MTGFKRQRLAMVESQLRPNEVTETRLLSPMRALPRERLDTLDRFDRVQLADVARVCADAGSLSEAGRALFSVSRKRRTTSNDADRLRKYLARFGLTWQALREQR